MRVATWNLWWRFGPWKERQPLIVRSIESFDADIVLCQEVFCDKEHGDQAILIGDQLGYDVAASRRADGTRMPFGNAILSRIPILEQTSILLTNASGEPGHRSAVAALVDGSLGPQWVVTTHLDWRYDGSSLRQRQLQTIVEWVIDLAGDPSDEQLPVVLGGDFNAVPESDEIRRLTGLSTPYRDGIVFTDAWAAVGDGDGHTWTRENDHSPDAQWPRRRLDYIFVSWPRPKPTGNPRRAELGGIETPMGSDHAAVIVDLDARPAGAHLSDSPTTPTAPAQPTAPTSEPTTKGA